MTEAQFLPQSYSEMPEQGSVTWRAPSNIALIKYWGKHGIQLPKNPSISFTLSKSHTTTTVSFQKKKNNDITFEIWFEGKPAPEFAPKIQTFLERIEPYMPLVNAYSFKIETSNSFPHSSGIASSASGMSALALCLTSIERSIAGVEMTGAGFNQKASFLSRLGSGSACRSIEGELVVWGAHDSIEGSTDLYGLPYPYEVHSIFKNFQDTILLVDKGEKQVSSTVGHNLMHEHPFAVQRFQQASDQLSRLVPVLEKGDLPAFINIVESEALSLHAMMLTSSPYFILMKPNTLEIINLIWEFRKTTGSHICFTLDAGANVHVLYPENEKQQVLAFVRSELTQFCKNGEYIEDVSGKGAQLISNKL